MSEGTIGIADAVKWADRVELHPILLVGAVAALALLGGCTDITGGDDPRPSFDAVQADSGSVEEHRATAGARTIRFQGNITTDDRCQRMSAQVEEFSSSQGVADIEVLAEGLENCPNEAETTWNYLGRLVDVPSGEYDVTIRHRFENPDRSSQVVFEGQVSVTSSSSP